MSASSKITTCSHDRESCSGSSCGYITPGTVLRLLPPVVVALKFAKCMHLISTMCKIPVHLYYRMALRHTHSQDRDSRRARGRASSAHKWSPARRLFASRADSLALYSRFLEPPYGSNRPAPSSSPLSCRSPSMLSCPQILSGARVIGVAACQPGSILAEPRVE